MALPTTKTPPITSLSELSVLIYGAPKIGKSTFCAGADHALFLATEAGLNHLETYQVPISTWDELLNACADLLHGDHKFQTVIIDTVNNAHQLCTEYILAKHGMKHPSDDNNKGYALVTNEFTRVLTRLSLLPYGLYLISHAEQIEVKTRTSTYRKWVPTLSGKSRQAVLGLVDIILYADMEEARDAEGVVSETRVLRTKPATSYEAGDRTGKLPEVIPLDYACFAQAFDPFYGQG